MRGSGGKTDGGSPGSTGTQALYTSLIELNSSSSSSHTVSPNGIFINMIKKLPTKVVSFYVTKIHTNQLAKVFLNQRFRI